MYRATRAFRATLVGASVLAFLHSPLLRADDYNGDGLDDVWQSVYDAWTLLPNNDDDGDGATNLTESIAGTNPRNPADVIRVGNVSLAGGNVIVDVKSQSGKRYQLQSNTVPVGGTWADEGGAVTGTGGVLQFVTPSGPNRKFYRVQTKDQDTDNDGASDWAEAKTGTNAALAFSSNNASGGVANDGDTLHSLMTLNVTTTTPDAYEKEGVDAKVAVSRSYGTMPLTVPITKSGNADITKGSASSDDYILHNPDNSVIAGGNLVLPANQGTPGNPFEVTVAPVTDALNEVPETLALTLKPSGAAAAPTTAMATVKLMDAENTTPNQKLFVAFLGREAGVNSFATGMATALLDGTNDSALVTVTFNSLSSAQNTCYIRIGADQEVLNIPNGSPSNKLWPIRSAQTVINDQGMLDALFAGELFVSISSANYPNKEIFGYFNAAAGSATFDPDNPALDPPAYAQPDTAEKLDRDIYRFLTQCTFGATTDLVNEVKAEITSAGGNVLTGYGNWLDKQMNPAITPQIDLMTLVIAADNEEFALRGNRPITYGNDPQYYDNASFTVTYDGTGNPMFGTANNNIYANNYPAGAANRRREWWTMVLQCKDQVRQRMAMALSEILVTSDMDQTTQDRHYGHAHYWDMLAAGAFGKYRNLLEQVTYSPMMGIYLSHMNNRRYYDAGGGLFVSPDENYAREIMQLFSIGLVLRHPDGSLVLDAEGLPVPTYDNTDITELARVMTGMAQGARHTSVTSTNYNGTTLTTSSQATSPRIEFNTVNYTSFSRNDGHRFFEAPWIYPMVAIGHTGGVEYHDFDSKVMFGGSERSGGASFASLKRTIAAKTYSTDAESHVLAAADLTEAHNALAGNPNSGTYDGHPNTPTNISRWLIQRLVTSNPRAGYIYRVSSVYRSTNGDLGAVLKAILLDPEARSLDFTDNYTAHGKVKEPMVHFANVLRSLKAFTGGSVSNLKNSSLTFGTTDSMLATPYPDSEFQKFAPQSPPSLPAGWASGPFRFRFGDTTNSFGQAPQRAPSVFNWFLPDYIVPGAMAQAGLYAPEMQISTESLEVSKVNWFWTYTWSNLVGMAAQPGTDSNVSGYFLNSANATRAFKANTYSLTFDSTNYNQPQTITLSALNDYKYEGSYTGQVTHSTTVNAGGSSAWSGLTSAPLDVSITDNEVPNEAVLVTQSSNTTWVCERNPVTSLPTSDTVTVQLTSPPVANVTITPSADAQVTLSPSTLTFTPANWGTPQTLTITAVDDATAEGSSTNGNHTSTLSFASSSSAANYNGLTIPSVTINIVDNENPGVLITESGTPPTTRVKESIATTGSDLDTYTAVLTKAPSATVTLSCTCNGTLQLNNSGNSSYGTSQSRSFTTANWNVPQTISLRGTNNSTVESTRFGNVNFAVPSAGGYSIASTAAFQATIDDDDCKILVDLGDHELRVQEGGFTDTYTIQLSSAPSAEVTVWPVSTPTTANQRGQVSVSPESISFTPGDWSTPRTVTVTAINDNDIEGLQTTSITHQIASTDAAFNTATFAPTLPVTVVDDDGGKLVITESGGFTAVNEQGSLTDTYTIALSSAPTANVTVSMTGNQVTTSPGSLTFTPANWNIAQTVTVQGADDVIADGETGGYVGHLVTSADPVYNGATARNVQVIVADDDPPSVFVRHSSGSTTVTEGGALDSFYVLLCSQPTANVVVTLTADSQTQIYTGTNAPGSVVSLTFTSSNWSTGQAVNVKAVDDALVEANPHASNISVAISSTAQGYSTATNIPSIPVSVTDNDSAGITVVENTTLTGLNGATANTEGSTDSFVLALTKAPTSNVTVTVTPSAGMEVNTTSGGTTTYSTSPVIRTFTTGNWSTAQNVNIRGVVNSVAEPYRTGTATIAVTSTSDASYTGKTGRTITMTVYDDDGKVAITANNNNYLQLNSTVVSETYNAVSTVQGQDTVTLSLRSAPTSDVTLDLAGDGQVMSVPSSITFKPSNYNLGQVIMVRAANDSVWEGDHSGTLTLTATSADANFNNTPVGSIPVSIMDNENARLALSTPGGAPIVREGSATQTGVYYASLAAPPSQNVTVTPNGNGQVTLSPASLTFTPANWSTPQAVTITAIDDAVAESTHSASVTHTVTSADSRFQGLSSLPISVTVLDNDGPALVITPSGGSTLLTESGTTDTYTIALNQAPPLGTTVTVNIEVPLIVTQVPPYTKMAGYFSTDFPASDQQKDRIVMDYTEIINLYLDTFYAKLSEQYGGSVPLSPGGTQLQNSHWAATVAILDRFDLWWCGGYMKAKWSLPTTAPTGPSANVNPRQSIAECLYFSYTTTRYHPQAAWTYDPKNPPVVSGENLTNFYNEVRDRSRMAAYLVSISPPGVVLK